MISASKHYQENSLMTPGCKQEQNLLEFLPVLTGVTEQVTAPDKQLDERVQIARLNAIVL